MKASKRTAIVIQLYVSKVQGKLFTALDANQKELEEFAIAHEAFHNLSLAVDEAVKKTLKEV